jgi:hypothetical protein
LVDRIFRQENPNYRACLIAAAESRLRNARSVHDKVLAAETKRLSGKGFNRDDVEDSPEVKRARGEVDRFELILSRMKSEPDESVWQSTASALLD